MLKSFVFYLAAVIGTSILISVVSTQLVLEDVASFGLHVSRDDRLAATLHDLMGLAVPLLLLVGLSFLVAFTVAKHACRHIGGNRTLWFMAAGLLSVPAAILGIKFAMGGTLLAAARSDVGMFLIACCSMLGGWLYAWLSSRSGSHGRIDELSI